MYRDPLTQADMAYERYKKLTPTGDDNYIPDDELEHVGTATTQLIDEADSTSREPAASALAATIDAGLIGEEHPRGAGSPSPVKREE
ncbi:hypothetical protein ACE41H_12135 [Paenibacillus enshidis]|uniref:DUF4025 domain-containing protein n=1 Tax=Paenibacillus enshidis TaxID=1458439 RepID=A0ABV5ATI3_9BACL